MSMYPTFFTIKKNLIIYISKALISLKLLYNPINYEELHTVFLFGNFALTIDALRLVAAAAKKKKFIKEVLSIALTILSFPLILEQTIDCGVHIKYL